MADSTPITPPAGAGDVRPTARPQGGDGETAFDAHLSHASPTGTHASQEAGTHHAAAHHAQGHGHHAHEPHETHHAHGARDSHHAHAARRAGVAYAAHHTSLSEPVRAAIGAAIDREGVPSSWQEGLEFIAVGESGGEVGAINPRSSARGLFQLTRANYQYNPNGEASFGDPVEEAQGGIRYIRDRYGDIGAAVSTWQKRRTY